MFQLLGSILSVAFGALGLLVQLIFGLIGVAVAHYKRRNALLWGIVIFIFPPVFFVLLVLPTKYPRFDSYLKGHDAFARKNPVVASIMALSAIVAKADGVITKDEIKLIRNYAGQIFHMTSTELNAYEGAFTYGKEHPEEYKEFTRIVRMYNGRKDFIISLSYLFISIGQQNQEYSSAEEGIVKDILFELGVSSYEYESLKTYFHKMKNGTGQSSYQRGFGQGNVFESREDLKKKYAEVLGIDENATLQETKKAYRSLAKKYHPDRMAQDGMPDDYVKFANEQIIKINEAYEYLKNEKEATA